MGSIPIVSTRKVSSSLAKTLDAANKISLARLSSLTSSILPWNQSRHQPLGDSRPLTVSSVEGCLDVLDEDHEVEVVGWRGLEAISAVEVAGRFIERVDNESSYGMLLGRDHGGEHGVTKKRGADPPALLSPVDGETAE